REASGKWVRVNKTPILDLKYRVTGLFEGNTYEFRVFAENMVGLSKPSPSSDPIKASRPITPPGPPINPKLKDKTKESADLVWTKPLKDGGSPILGYIVECQKTGTTQWNRINKDELIRQCAFRVPGLIEGNEYKFRIKAVNIVGEGEPRELPETVLAKDILAPPEISLDVTCRDLITVRVGQTIHITGKVKGRPDPDITWSKDGKVLVQEKRVEILHDLPNVELQVKEAKRSDHGKYIIAAKNSCGQAQAFAVVNVLDRPGPCPVRNLKVTDISSDRCTVTWDPPEDDGGCEIQNYILEKCESKRMVWSTYSSSVLTNYAKVTRLIEGNEYIFRVRAENKMGTGPPTETHPIIAKTKYDRPGRPDPPDVTRVSKEEMTVVWNPPEYDGGKSITGYILEKKEKRSLRWVPVTKTPIPERRKKVTNLFPGHEYQFRVSAENEVGLGEPSLPSRPVIAKDPIEPPGPPTNLRVVDSTKTSLTLGWGKPVYDGGAPIIGYVVEMRPKVEGADPEAGWKRCNVAAQVIHTEFTATSLDEKQLYEFRVSAQNQVGLGRPAELKEAVSPKEILEPPEIELDASMRKLVTVRAGCPIRLFAIVRGRPAPKVTWRRMGIDNVIRKGQVDLVDTMAFCVIPDSTRDDSGKYSLTLVNAAGEKAVFVNVRVLDTPGPVSDFKVSDVTKMSCHLSWAPPENDGGSPVTHYILQKREADRKTWATVTAELKKTSFQIANLVPGNEYYFRVTAVNEYGSGVPSDIPKPILASDPLSEPDPPRKLEVTEITKNSATLGWLPPLRDGGSKIDGYIVSYKEHDQPADRWTEYSVVKDLSIVVAGL
ncbi:TITIN protein, partial [Edolisoma coerulescens]|nr:TITIN protein [Edolisoma coerulescens]